MRDPTKPSTPKERIRTAANPNHRRRIWRRPLQPARQLRFERLHAEEHLLLRYGIEPQQQAARLLRRNIDLDHATHGITGDRAREIAVACRPRAGERRRFHGQAFALDVAAPHELRECQVRNEDLAGRLQLRERLPALTELSPRVLVAAVLALLLDDDAARRPGGRA